MNKYIFCIFIFLIIISLLILYFRKVKESYEFFDITPADQAKYAAAIAAATTSAVEAVTGGSTSATTTTTIQPSFLIYEDRFYMIKTDGKIYCKYISGGDWFQLCNNYESSEYVSTKLKDITVTKENNVLYIYALFGNSVCKKQVEDISDPWDYLSDLNSLGNISQISSNQNNLIFYVPSTSDDDSETNTGIYMYDLGSDSSPIKIDSSINYVSLRLNSYSTDNFLYGLFVNVDGDVIPVKKTLEESTGEEEGEDDFDDSFDFGEMEFVDLFVTNTFLYGLAKDKYVYRKSIKSDIVGNESYSWDKVTSILPSNSIMNNKKKISVYNGYIYCLDDQTIKKHRIYGYSWIDIDNFEYENQYYTIPPSKMIQNIHRKTDKNMDPQVLNMIPMGDFSFSDAYSKSLHSFDS